jgi:membrane-bound lytic murein transglycosylase A
MPEAYFQQLMRFKLLISAQRRLRTGALVLFAAALSACTQSLVIADDLDRTSLAAALRQSQNYLEKLPRDRVLGEQPRRLTAGEALDSLGALEPLLARWQCWDCFVKELRERFEFVPATSDVSADPVLFTGYYQPVIQASLVPTDDFRFPIYRTPADLITSEQADVAAVQEKSGRVIGRLVGNDFHPYYSRREIDQLGALRGRGLEIAWVKDPIDIFFLQIQGSGLLQLSDGRRLHVNYAAQNGLAYRSIGRLLIDQGKIPQEEMSMQRLRQYLQEHPEERDEIFYYNESYVFFRLLDEGPFGSLEVLLTPGRSIATDARLFPKGALAFIATEKPVIASGGELAGWQPLSRLVLNQDTGGAIRGPRRVDLFFGAGESAASEAGYMNRQGRLYFLYLKQAPAEERNRAWPSKEWHD